MRVISGKYRGLKIDGYDIVGTRPTMDRVKESMFAMIQTKLKGAVVLDLFSGSGNLGIEAISNGSREVYFVDNNKIATDTIIENLKKIHVKENYHVMRMDYMIALDELKQKQIHFDIVFLDPPYRNHFINEILEKLVEMNLLNDNALVVCEFDKEEVASNLLTCIKERKYSDKYVRIYRK